MSGSPRTVELVADADGVVARLVHTAGVFGQASVPPWALVGGLAVMVQLAEARRATAAVDTVADDDAGDLVPALAVLAALTETFVTDGARSARRLSVSARGPASTDIGEIDLEVVGSLCADAIWNSLI